MIFLNRIFFSVLVLLLFIDMFVTYMKYETYGEINYQVRMIIWRGFVLTNSTQEDA